MVGLTSGVLTLQRLHDETVHADAAATRIGAQPRERRGIQATEQYICHLPWMISYSCVISPPLQFRIKCGTENSAGERGAPRGGVGEGDVRTALHELGGAPAEFGLPLDEQRARRLDGRGQLGRRVVLFVELVQPHDEGGERRK